MYVFSLLALQNSLFIIFKLIKNLNINKIFKFSNSFIKNDKINCYLLKKKILYHIYNRKLLFLNINYILNINSLIVPHSFINVLFFFFKNQHITLKKHGTLKFSKYSHYDMIKKLKIVDLNCGKHSIGDRGYFLVKEGVDLNLSLINYGFKFLNFFNYFKIWSPCFIKKVF